MAQTSALDSRQSAVRAILRSWGTCAELHAAQYVWVLSMFGLLAALEANRVGLFLVPPFGATLTLLLMLPDAPVAQPWAVVAGSVAGAGVGTLLSFAAHGPLMAIAAAVLAFAIINLVHAYHPPGVALAMYPLLLHTSPWFPLAVVLPFTVAATGSAALLSRWAARWPAYPRPLHPAR